MKPEAAHLTIDQLEAVLAFLSKFERRDNATGEWSDGAEGGLFWEPNPQVQAFVQTFYDQECIFSFDWRTWANHGSGVSRRSLRSAGLYVDKP